MSEKWNGWHENETDHKGKEIQRFWIARWTRLAPLFPTRLLKSQNSHVWKWNGWSVSIYHFETDGRERSEACIVTPHFGPLGVLYLMRLSKSRNTAIAQRNGSFQKWNGWQGNETDDEGVEIRWFWIACWTRLVILYRMRVSKSEKGQLWKWNGWTESETDEVKVKRMTKEWSDANSDQRVELALTPSF